MPNPIIFGTAPSRCAIICPTVKAYAVTIAVVLLIAWNIYTGLTVSEIGVPGFNIKFGSRTSGDGNENSSKPVEVVDIAVAAEPPHTNHCPIEITFNGTISAVGHGTVYYQFHHSNGSETNVQPLFFNATGSQDVRWTYRAGEPGTEKECADSGWVVIDIVEPKHLESKRAVFVADCAASGQAHLNCR